MKKLSTVSKTLSSYITLCDYIEDALMAKKKAAHFRKWTDERYIACLTEIAAELDVDPAELIEYYFED